MRTSIAGFLLGLLLALVPVSAGISQEHVTLPGAVWAIVPPPDFAIVTGQPLAVFRHPSGAIILVQDTPKRPVTKADFDATPEQAADTRVDELTEVTVDGKHGFLAVIHLQSRRATTIALIVEGNETNGNIIAAIPDSVAGEVSPDEIRKAVLSAVEQPKTIDDRLADLPFTIGAISGMRVTHYVPGGVVFLTDGPADDPEVSSEQSFATIAAMDTGGVAFNPHGDLGAMVQRVKQEYPDAQVLSSKILERPEGNIAEIRYERTTKTSRLVVGGVTWAKQVGSRAVVMICQHPRGDEAAFAKLRRVRDGLRAK